MKHILGGIGIVIFLVVALVFFEYKCEEIGCNKTGESLGYNSEYDIWTGCVLERDGDKFLLEQLRNIKGVE